MMVTGLMVTWLWSTVAVTTDLGGVVLPNFAVVLALWAGLRTWRRLEDIVLVMSAGLLAGLFLTDPWFLSPALCVLGLATGHGLSRTFGPRGMMSRALVLALVLLFLYAAEALLRLSVPSLTLDAGTAFGMACQGLLSLPLALLLDQLTPQRP